MITPQSILQRSNLQTLVVQCMFDTTEETNFYNKFATEKGIDERVRYLESASATKRFPIYHILYDETIDEFQLNVDFFDKQNDVTTWVSNQYKILRWVPSVKNEYVLMFSTGAQVGDTFKQKLPVIRKTS